MLFNLPEAISMVCALLVIAATALLLYINCVREVFAGYVKDNELGLIIGEAPGNNPNGYGEIAAFKLPNSELFMQISTKRFYRTDKSCKDELVIPDIECNREEAMAELYRCIRGN